MNCNFGSSVLGAVIHKGTYTNTWSHGLNERHKTWKKNYHHPLPQTQSRGAGRVFQVHIKYSVAWSGAELQWWVLHLSPVHSHLSSDLHFQRNKCESFWEIKGRK